MRNMSPALFGERLRALRGPKTRDEIAAAVSIPVQTYRRYELGETEKLPFDDVVSIGKLYRFTPNEMAPLADVWITPELLDREDEIRQFVTETFLNFLLDLPPSRQETMLELIKDLIDIQNQKQRVEEEFVSTSVLPEWARNKRKAAGGRLQN